MPSDQTWIEDAESAPSQGARAAALSGAFDAARRVCAFNQDVRIAMHALGVGEIARLSTLSKCLDDARLLYEKVAFEEAAGLAHALCELEPHLHRLYTLTGGANYTSMPTTDTAAVVGALSQLMATLTRLKV